MAKSWTSTVQLEPVRGAVREGSNAGLEAAARHVFDVAQRDVPYEKGDLSRSGDSGLVGEGRAAITYRDRGAVDSHERTDIPAANGRSRKWLERALASERRQAGEIVAAEIRRRLGT